MMTSEELKHSLMNYHNIKRWKQLNDNKIDEVVNNMKGVKGIRYDMEKSKGGSPVNQDKRMISLIEKKDKLMLASDYYQVMIDEVDNFIKWVEEPYKQIIRDKYIHEFDNDFITKKYHLSKSNIHYNIDRCISNYTNG